MNAVVWRLHRHQAYVAGAALAVLSVALLITGLMLGSDYHSFLASCGATHSCGDTGQLFSSYRLASVLVDASIAVPLLFGLFWGAPLLAREFEEGTHNLVWTQGVTRRHWLSRNVMWAVLAAAVWGAALAALVSWWRIPANALDFPASRLSPGQFDIQGMVPVAYSVFAVALGIAAGSVIKRVVPAMATTLAVFVGLRLVVAQYARPHFMSAVSKVIALPTVVKDGGGAPAGSWAISDGIVGPGGQYLGHGLRVKDVQALCGGFVSPQCLSSHGYHLMITYQPAGRFWAFQGIETGIFIVLAAALLAFTYRVVLTRDA